MSDMDAFRAEIRKWIEENCPAEMRTPTKGDEDVCWGGRNFIFQSEAQKQWLERCAAKGYTVPDWAPEYGGAGMSPAEAKIFRQEMARAKARSPLNSFGIWMLGPALLKFGTETALFAANRTWRNPLVSGLFRARFGQRPCFDADLW
jgi:acyl-CoA dehydrogenase